MFLRKLEETAKFDLAIPLFENNEQNMKVFFTPNSNDR